MGEYLTYFLFEPDDDENPESSDVGTGWNDTYGEDTGSDTTDDSHETDG